MRDSHPVHLFCPAPFIWAPIALSAGTGPALAASILTGRVTDASDRAVPNAEISIRQSATSLERTAVTNVEGDYEIASLPVGVYRMTVRANGFQPYVAESLTIAVARTVVQDARLSVGDVSHEVVVTAQTELLDRASIALGQLIDEKTMQQIPLNGRYMLDLGLLVAGSVAPSQNGFSTTPSRGVGALAINTGGTREDAVNYLINGITLDNLTYSSISFQPSISSVQEFRVENSSVSAEYGQSSGAAVHLATRSGSSALHGELFEFVRNSALDARNYFNFTSHKPPQFQRNQLGGDLGGPLAKDKAFY